MKGKNNNKKYVDKVSSNAQRFPRLHGRRRNVVSVAAGQPERRGVVERPDRPRPPCQTPAV